MKRKNMIKCKRIVQFLLGPFRPIFQNRIYTIRSGPAKGMKRKGGFGFLPFWMDEEENFFLEIDLQNKIVYDIGANIGILSIFFAKKVGARGYVYCFEPNPDSALSIMRILKLNKIVNAEVHTIAVGDNISKGSLVIHGNQAGRGSINNEIVNNFIKRGNNKIYEVEIFTLDVYIKQSNLPPPDFIKIDTEGYEYQCLLGMKNLLETKHPQLFIEMHAISHQHGGNNSKNIIELLDGYKYKIYSIRQQAIITQANYYLAKSGHLFCS